MFPPSLELMKRARAFGESSLPIKKKSGDILFLQVVEQLLELLILEKPFTKTIRDLQVANKLEWPPQELINTETTGPSQNGPIKWDSKRGRDGEHEILRELSELHKVSLFDDCIGSGGTIL